MGAGALRCRDLKKRIPLAPSPHTVPRCCCRELPADTALSSLFAPHKSRQSPLLDGGKAAGIPTHTREFPWPRGCAWDGHIHTLGAGSGGMLLDGRVRGYAATHGRHPRAAHPSCAPSAPVAVAGIQPLCVHVHAHTRGEEHPHRCKYQAMCTYIRRNGG